MLNIGDKFSRLTVLEYHHSDHRHRKYYSCKCDCGNTVVVHGASLTSGNTRSCGCFAKEARRATRLPDNASVIHHIRLQYERHARNRNLVFELDDELFRKLILSPCHYCGLPPSNIKTTKNFREGFSYSGIDRVKNNIGYVKGNAVPCCETCNRAKRDLPLDKFLSWIKRVYDFQK